MENEELAHPRKWMFLGEKNLDVTPEKLAGLTITPEKTLKKGILSKKLPAKAIEPDPLLDMTPEKHSFISKTTQKKQTRVRFNVPEIQDNSNELTPNEYVKTISGKRCPLQDISCDNLSYETQSCTDTSTSTSWYSNESDHTSLDNESTCSNLAPKDMKGCIIGPKNTKLICDNLKSNIKENLKDGIIEVQSEQNKANKKINRLTKHNETLDLSEKKSNILKKNKGLHKHQHTVRYGKESSENDDNVLSRPNYNSSLAIGQELQTLRYEEFNPDFVVSKKLSKDEDLKIYLSEKMSAGTNIPFDDKLYRNLVNVEGSENWKEQVSHMPTFKKLKALPKPPKVTQFSEPDIMDNFSVTSHQETIILDFKSIKLTSPLPVHTAVDEAMILDTLSNIWTDI